MQNTPSRSESTRWSVEPVPVRRSGESVPVRPPRRQHRPSAASARHRSSSRRQNTTAQRRSVRFSGRTLTKTNGSLGRSGPSSGPDSDSDSSSAEGRDNGGGGTLDTADGYFSSPTNSITGRLIFSGACCSNIVNDQLSSFPRSRPLPWPFLPCALYTVQ